MTRPHSQLLRTLTTCALLCALLCAVMSTPAVDAAPGDRPSGRVLVRAQALQQRMFGAMVPLVRTLDRAHAGTPAWWIALLDADRTWRRYVADLSALRLPPGQLQAMTVSPRGALHRFDDALRAGFTLALTGHFVLRPQGVPDRLPKDPRDLPASKGRVRFAGRSRNGATVLIVDTDRCQGDERSTAHTMPPNRGYGAKARVVQQTGLELEGGRPGAPSASWERLRQRNDDDRFTDNPFIQQSTSLVKLSEKEATWVGPGQRRAVKLRRPPMRRQLRWSQRGCCGWVVDNVWVDTTSGRAFAGLVERCRWNAIEGDDCFDPAQRDEAYANQHCRLRELHWVRFGRVMRANQLFERPRQTYFRGMTF